MKIVNRKTFLEMPGDVLFKRFEHHMRSGSDFQDLKFKRGISSKPEFAMISFSSLMYGKSFNDLARILRAIGETGLSTELDFESRTQKGYAVSEQLLAIWESQDIKDLILQLEKLYLGQL